MALTSSHPPPLLAHHLPTYQLSDPSLPQMKSKLQWDPSELKCSICIRILYYSCYNFYLSVIQIKHWSNCTLFFLYSKVYMLVGLIWQFVRTFVFSPLGHALNILLIISLAYYFTTPWFSGTLLMVSTMPGLASWWCDRWPVMDQFRANTRDAPASTQKSQQWHRQSRKL